MIRVKLFNVIGPDASALEEFVNEIGWDAVKNFSVAHDGRGNVGGIVVYEEAPILVPLDHVVIGSGEKSERSS